MKTMEKIKAAWKIAFDEMNQSPVFMRIARGEVTPEHYQMVLRQIFHHARENPQIQALAAVHFRGHQREMVSMFFKHAIQEIGHDQLALNDLKAMGVDVSSIPYERPLPATTALLSYPFFQITQRNPLGYLGYLFFLEFTPTHGGEKYMELFKAIGVPEEALSFIHEHATVDIAHNKMMEKYIERLVTTEEEIEEICYAVQVTGRLYTDMITSAFAHVDRPRVYGYQPMEVLKAAKAA